jgi:hypothetical protein
MLILYHATAKPTLHTIQPSKAASAPPLTTSILLQMNVLLARQQHVIAALLPIKIA